MIPKGDIMSSTRRLRRRQPTGYQEKVLAFAKSLVLQSGTLTQLAVIHSDDCPMNNGGECSCDPDVKLLKDVLTN
jgi:hypothetical protein